MIYIAHRGNIYEKKPDQENTPEYISIALKSEINVEIDVWFMHGTFFLGHDNPQTPVNENFLYQDGLWIHAKNVEALNLLKNKCNCFFHDHDDYTLTSKNYIWVYPGKPLVSGCVAVLPETVNYSDEDLKKCYAICSDNVLGLYDKINNI